ncbi:hypothetical protein J4417_04610 [Candidatus Woesearchaeota archaeon]|nr:hypothetical protein [Candidatus Woesearchaeota archaeon]
MEQIISKENEHRVKVISRLYYGLYVYGKQNTDVDISDLEQAGRIAVYDISRKRAEMLDHAGYVSAAIKYACLGEIKKMRHKVRQVYLTHQHEEMVPIVDLLPTKERGETAPEHLEQMDDLLYHIKHEFSPREADALDSLVQGCRNVYDLNLSKPPTTETKDKVKVVTAMDLDDEEMIIYAQVLTGAKSKFPDGYCLPKNRGQERGKKYFDALLKALNMSSREFAQSPNQEDLLRLYRLHSFVDKSYQHRISKLILEGDSDINLEDIKNRGKKWDLASTEQLSAIVQRLKSRLGKTPEEINSSDFIQNNLDGMIQQVFRGSIRLAVEFTFPGTHHKYRYRAKELREKYTP